MPLLVISRASRRVEKRQSHRFYVCSSNNKLYYTHTKQNFRLLLSVFYFCQQRLFALKTFILLNEFAEFVAFSVQCVYIQQHPSLSYIIQEFGNIAMNKKQSHVCNFLLPSKFDNNVSYTVYRMHLYLPFDMDKTML